MAFGRIFGTKKEEKHPEFPNLPQGIRLGGLVKFKASAQTYFMLNENKLVVKLDGDDAIIDGVSTFQLMGLNIYRLFLKGPKVDTIIQIHEKRGEILDVILFNQTYSFDITGNRKERENWSNLIGWKDMTIPSGQQYFREWSADVSEYGDFVEPLAYSEKYFNVNDQMKMVTIRNRGMLYTRILDGGTDEDIEFLLPAFVNVNGDERIDILCGTVIGVEGVEFY